MRLKRVCGAIAVQSKLNALPFTSDELSFLEAIGNTAIVAIENSRLYLQELEVQRMESELKIAAQIQRGLLPVDVSIAPELDIAASAATSKMIGGDYYDVIRLDEDRVLFAIADVSGKGVPAALLMANVQAALNVLARLHLPLHTLATRLNELVCENTEPEVFVTMFLCVINTSLQSIEYVNIGHNPQILLHGNDLELLTEGGIVAGVIPHPPEYRCGVGSLYSGDTLVLYTDGVTEARNGLTEFGLSALVDVVRAVRAEPASKIVDAVTAAVHNHSQRKELDDDTTLLIIKYL
jgi:sigma-B regulation protein RsbU (phosphoserine phosphatase)